MLRGAAREAPRDLMRGAEVFGVWGAPAPAGFSRCPPGPEQPSGRRWRRAGGRGAPGGGGGGGGGTHLLARLVSAPEIYLPPPEIIFVAVVVAAEMDFVGRTRP